MNFAGSRIIFGTVAAGEFERSAAEDFCVRKVWARIEAVLRTTAPDRHPALAVGAMPEAIAAAEARLGFRLPLDVAESYAVHNGSGDAGIIPCSLYSLITVSLHSLDEMVREWEMWQEWRLRGGTQDRPASPECPVKADRYNPRWVPVAWDGGGVNLCIDLDPAPGGVAGQMIYLDHLDPQCVAAESWRAFLELYADNLESGRLRFVADGLEAADADAAYAVALEALIAEQRHAAPGTSSVE